MSCSVLVALALHMVARADGPLPERFDTRETIAATWASTPEGRVSEWRAFASPGTRVGALVLSDEVLGAVGLEVALRFPDGRQTPFLPVPVRSEGAGWQVRVLDLDEPASLARVRLRGLGTLAQLAWELRVPVDEPRGEPQPPPPGVSAALSAIGVVPRESWGARATTCTSTEDDWYRMAIHHTAGNQTSGGTVQGAVQALQAYAMDSGGYCDIPYQFLIGHDGSLWEGRNLAYYSGATGGGNNDGNIALSFLGCYTGSGCPGSSHAVTEEMMAWARVLAQTLAAEHGFVTTEDVLKGHRDWPGNSTVCPGDDVYARLDELRSGTSYYQGSLSFDSAAGGLRAVPGEEREVELHLLNVGLSTWTAGGTFLAPTPRDQPGIIAAGDWLGPTRIATLDEDVPPGQVGRFTFRVSAESEGSYLQHLSLVQEGVTWFGDLPFGGGPGDEELAIALEVRPADGGEGGEEPSDGGAAGGGEGDGVAADGPPGRLSPFPAGAGCRSAPLAGPGGILVSLLLLGRRRRARVVASGPDGEAHARI